MWQKQLNVIYLFLLSLTILRKTEVILYRIAEIFHGFDICIHNFRYSYSQILTQRHSHSQKSILDDSVLTSFLTSLVVSVLGNNVECNCWPIRRLLGYHIQALEKGATKVHFQIITKDRCILEQFLHIFQLQLQLECHFLQNN